MQSRLTAAVGRPWHCTALLECAIAASLACLTLYLAHHAWSANRFLELASRYDGRRMWRDNEPPVSAQVRDIELRLRQDLDNFESVRDGRHWNEVVWQTWRDTSLEHWRSTWSAQNPTWNYTLLLDAAADKLIRETFEEVPDVIDLWTSFPKPVLRADLFRYLITYAFGGMYADADTSCTRSIDYWILQDDWNDPTVHSVIGIEYADEGHGANGWWRFFDFVQYVMLSKPLSPVMRETIILVVTRTHRLIEWQQKESVQDVDWDFNSVIKTTGPASFTDACLKVIERETSWNEAMVAQKTYGRMSSYKMGGVVVVPVKDWQAGGKGVPERYFIHHGQGSWI